MPRPGVQFADIASAPRRFAPTATDTAFMIGMADKGSSTTWTLANTFDDWVTNHGTPIIEGQASAAAECFFRDGGAKLYTVVVRGPARIKATVALAGTVGTAANVVAKQFGAFYNRYTVDVVVTGAQFQLVIRDSIAAVILETSPLFNTVTDAVAWSVGSSNVDVVAGAGTGNPVAILAAALTGGLDDRAGVTQTDYDTALTAFGSELGPGQVFAPGVTTATMGTSLANHAAANNRFGLYDLPNSTSKATLKTAGAAVTTIANNKYVMILGGYQIIPAVVAGVPRTVPRSGTVAGLIARQDIATRNPNLAAAGDQGTGAGDSVFATGIVYTPTAADRQELNDANVNLALNYYGAIRNYGFRTAAPQLTNPNNWQASNVRLDMAIKAEATAAGERFVFSQIDGRGFTAARFAGVLTGILQRYYALGALYDNSASGGLGGPNTAFTVDTGPTVNTPDLVAAGTLTAALQVRRSPFAELVNIKIRVVSTREELIA